MQSSSPDSKTELEPAAGGSTDELSWEAWPFRARPVRGLAVLGVILILATGLGVGMGSWGWSVFAGLVLFLSLEGFYFPTRFLFTDDGAQARRLFHRSFRSWETVQRVLEDPSGIYLCPSRRLGRFQTFRAFHLFWGEGDSDPIRDRVRDRIGPEVEWTRVS